MPDFSALTYQRERIAAQDTHHSTLNDQLTGLKKKKEKVTKALEHTKSSLEAVKGHIDKLKHKQESLIEKKERKQSSKLWLTKQRASKSGQDLVELDQLIRDTEEAVAELSKQIDKLEKKITAQNDQVAEATAQLVQKEREKKQIEIKMKEIQKEKSSIESKLEEDRRTFDQEMLKMMSELKLSKVRTCIQYNVSVTNAKQNTCTPLSSAKLEFYECRARGR